MRLTSRVCSVALFLLTGLPTWAGTEAVRPSIVVFLADDMGWAECSPYGGRDIPTPNMARLAAEGMNLTHAFVASPSCAPSRAALLTGLDPMRNGAMLNHARPRPGLATWPDDFHKLGYEVVSFGKTAHYAQVKNYGFDFASHYRYHEDDCIGAALAWLAQRKSDRPLCLLVGTNWSYVPWPEEVAVDRSNSEHPLPPNLVDTPATRQAWARYSAAVGRADRDLGLIYDAAREHLGSDTLFVFSSDHGAQFPFAKWNGYDVGIRTPLIVAWPGKIAPGSLNDALVSWIDLLPTCIEAAGGSPRQELSGKSFLGVLLGEQQAHREAVHVSHSGDGSMNQYPLRAVRTRRWKYIRNLDPDAEHHTHIDLGVAVDGRSYWDSWVKAASTDPHAAEIVRRYSHRPPEELYDLEADPWELANIASDPTHAATLTQLRADLDAWMAAQGDTGLATERALPDPRASPAK